MWLASFTHYNVLKALPIVAWINTSFLISWIIFHWSSLVAQMVKNPPAMQETWVQSSGREDPLEKGMATHSCILAWRIPWTEEPGGLHTVHGVAKSWTWLSDFNSLTQYSILWIYHILFIHHRLIDMWVISTFYF